MQILVDAQLPQKLATLLSSNGHEVIHTVWSPDKNRTKDDYICRLADAENRIVVSKDADFVTPHFLLGSPPKLRQKAFETPSRGAATAPITYYVFDMPFFQGYDLEGVSLNSGGRCLKASLTNTSPATSGSVPRSMRRRKKLHDWTTVKGLSQAVVQHLAKTIPQKFVAKRRPKNRVGKIFVDYLRNGFGATTISAWSAREGQGWVCRYPLPGMSYIN